MSILYMGDIHGDLFRFESIRAVVSVDDVIIHVGDFGVDRHMIKRWDEKFDDFPCLVYFIDGNHENFDIIDTWSKSAVTEVGDGLFYIPRGMVMEIQGKRIGFLGGGPSIDKYWRIKGETWWPQEVITDADVDLLLRNVGDIPLDVLVTHVSPTWMNLKHFGPLDKKEWYLPNDWEDTCSMKVEFLSEFLKPALHVCGHMHRSIPDGHVRILDINEVWSPNSFNG